MKKILIIAAILGGGYYLLKKKDTPATENTNPDNAAKQLDLSDIFTDYDNYVIRDNHGYNLLVRDGKVTLIPESSVTNMNVTPVDLNIYDQLMETSPELIDGYTPPSTSREVTVFSDVPVSTCSATFI